MTAAASTLLSPRQQRQLRRLTVHLWHLTWIQLPILIYVFVFSTIATQTHAEVITQLAFKHAEWINWGVLFVSSSVSTTKRDAQTRKLVPLWHDEHLYSPFNHQNGYFYQNPGGPPHQTPGGSAAQQGARQQSVFAIWPLSAMYNMLHGGWVWIQNWQKAAFEKSAIQAQMWHGVNVLSDREGIRDVIMALFSVMMVLFCVSLGCLVFTMVYLQDNDASRDVIKGDGRGDGFGGVVDAIEDVGGGGAGRGRSRSAKRSSGRGGRTRSGGRRSRSGTGEAGRSRSLGQNGRRWSATRGRTQRLFRSNRNSQGTLLDLNWTSLLVACALHSVCLTLNLLLIIFFTLFGYEKLSSAFGCRVFFDFGFAVLLGVTIMSVMTFSMLHTGSQIARRKGHLGLDDEGDRQLLGPSSSRRGGGARGRRSSRGGYRASTSSEYDSGSESDSDFSEDLSSEEARARTKHRRRSSGGRDRSRSRRRSAGGFGGSYGVASKTKSASGQNYGHEYVVVHSSSGRPPLPGGQPRSGVAPLQQSAHGAAAHLGQSVAPGGQGGYYSHDYTTTTTSYAAPR